MPDYSNYGQNNLGLGSSETLFSQFTGAAIALLVILVLIGLAVAIVVIIAQCKLYAKAGEKWWTAIIPMWNTWVLTKIVGLKWYWYLIMIGAAVLTAMLPEKFSYYIGGWGTLLISFNYNYNLAKKFGKGNGFAFLNTILPVIGFPILAFGSSKYNKDASVKGNGIFEVNW